MDQNDIEKTDGKSCPTTLAVQNRDSIPLTPGPRLAPFYITARTAPRVQLSFIVQGCKGELLDFPVNTIDLAFSLKQTPKRKGWKPTTIDNSVVGFLDEPLMQIQKRGKEAEIGLLYK
ncbi:hypothetical protein IQ06DRAFT_342231 [Phaeosphaeriaceae sp. SRC1lsM3a]|nr:hypothetical protein IQ06DRAFT_342231 [Stagonospora sp. SRC1lsM3a]